MTLTFLGGFFTRVSNRMSSNKNMYISTAFDISTQVNKQLYNLYADLLL